MKVSELRQKTAVELNDELLSLRHEQFKLRMQLATGQLARNHQLRQVRRGIARVKTLLNQKAAEQQVGNA